MQLGMIGLGRMGANMVRRLHRSGIAPVGYARSRESVDELVDEGIMVGADDLADLVDKLERPRAVWIMIPAGVVDDVIEELTPLLDADDVIIDGGNSHYPLDIERSDRLGEKGIHYLDVGTSGGVHGLERGYCLMIGGETEVVDRLGSIFAALAPGVGAAGRTEGRDGQPTQPEHGYLHCGPAGAGHFVKMIHNGVEYAIMAAYAEGFNLLSRAGIGREDATVDAETAPMANPRHYQYQINVADVAEVWRRGSVVGSWLLDLSAEALLHDGDLSQYQGRVSDSGEGRWTALAAIETGTPAPTILDALFSRFASRGNDLFANQVLSAMRAGFGGHRERGGS
ncbi:MAG: decarboxylating 6-phosphogluconate dehydrogenase [Acidimicrobiia bacterium]|nr:decarboxylating 6-phosphogluconate dehydrogenase [Acidimicrobiia bacterium]